MRSSPKSFNTQKIFQKFYKKIIKNFIEKAILFKSKYLYLWSYGNNSNIQ